MQPTDAHALATPMPMEGAGSYNRHSEVQGSVLAPILPLLQAAARTAVLAPAPAPLLVVDYGSSEGRNSLLPITLVIAALRERCDPHRAICVVHNDLPGSNFAALFEVLERDPHSYLRGDPSVYAAAVGRSFYQCVVPPHSVTLGWSSWSAQWLSRVPQPIGDQVSIGYTRDRGVRAAFARQAAADWETFVSARGRELRPGGKLVVLAMAAEDSGDVGYRAVSAAIYYALCDLIAARFVGEAEVRRMVIPTYPRTRAEFLAPFAASGECGGLAVESAELFAGEDRIWAETREGRDRAAFGARWAAFSRASVFPTLAAALDGGADDPRRSEFADRMEAAMAARLAAAPEKALIPLVKLVLVKRDSDGAGAADAAPA